MGSPRRFAPRDCDSIFIFNRIKKIPELARRMQSAAEILALVGTTGKKNRHCESASAGEAIHLQTACRTCGVNGSPRRIYDAPRDDDEAARVPILARDCFTSFAVAILLLFFKHLSQLRGVSSDTTRQSLPWSARVRPHFDNMMFRTSGRRRLRRPNSHCPREFDSGHKYQNKNPAKMAGFLFWCPRRESNSQPPV